MYTWGDLEKENQSSNQWKWWVLQKSFSCQINLLKHSACDYSVKNRYARHIKSLIHVKKDNFLGRFVRTSDCSFSISERKNEEEKAARDAGYVKDYHGSGDFIVVFKVFWNGIGIFSLVNWTFHALLPTLNEINFSLWTFFVFGNRFVLVFVWWKDLTRPFYRKGEVWKFHENSWAENSEFD